MIPKVKVGIFVFDSYINLYHESILAIEKMMSINTDVTIVGCSGGLNRCTNFQSFGVKIDNLWLAENRENICKRCIRMQQELSTSKKFYYSEALDSPSKDQLAILNKFKALEHLPVADILDIEYKNYALGKITFYDYSISNKISKERILNNYEINDYLEYLKDGFSIYNMLMRLSGVSYFNAVIYINGNYSYNSLISKFYKALNISSWSLEFASGQSDPEKIIYFEPERFTGRRDWVAMKKLYSSYKVNSSETTQALELLKNRINGIDHNSYTHKSRDEGWEAFDLFKKKYQRVVTIFVSSEDEFESHICSHGFEKDNSIFFDQIEWLEYIISNSDDKIGYVIRMHPRMMPNKKDKIVAQEYYKLMSRLEKVNLKKNFLIISSENLISSYYVMIQSSACIVSWSTIGFEAAVIGMPVAVCFPLHYPYPIENITYPIACKEDVKKFISLDFPLNLCESNDIDVLKLFVFLYKGLGVKVPGIRSVNTRKLKIISLIIRYTLTSKLLFLIFYPKSLNSIKITPNGVLNFSNEKNLYFDGDKSLKLLYKFRKDLKLSLAIC